MSSSPYVSTSGPSHILLGHVDPEGVNLKILEFTV